MGRPPIGKRAMTAAERQRRRRERLAASEPKKPQAAPLPPIPRKDAGLANELLMERRENNRLAGENKRLQQRLDGKTRARVRIAMPEEVEEARRKLTRDRRAFEREQRARIDRLTDDEFRMRAVRPFTKPEWNDVMRALHPDNSASKEVRERAFDALKVREKTLRAGSGGS